MVNLVRVPQGGRDFETLGEDPFLMSQLVAHETRGVQGQGTIATIKHFAENNQENQRQTINVNVDEQTLHEIELPAFQASVNAGAGAVMCAYNSVNGLHSCENPTLLTDILRSQWGFTGWVLSDYGANHSAGPALAAGLDMEFLSSFFAGLKAAVIAGTIPGSAIDTAVRHILTSMDRFGLLEHASPTGGAVFDHPRPTIDVAADAQVARQVAEQGAVLLKNDGGTLPLTGEDLGSLAVIGPTARHLLVGGGGSAHVVGITDREKSPLTALTEAAGPANVSFAVGDELDGVAVPASALAPTGGAAGSQGLLRTQTPGGATQVDGQVDFTGPAALHAAVPATTWTWTGTLTAPTTGDYDLKVQALGGAAASGSPFAPVASINLDGTVLGTVGGLFPTNGSLIPTADRLMNAGTTVHLEAGVLHSIAVAGSASPTSPLQVRLAWVTPQLRQARIDEAVAAARSARTPVVFAYNEGTEGLDRNSLSLPGDQDQLIQAVASANPRTVVVLNTGASVTMPWASNVASILEMWYPGQEGGDATAAVLLGEAAPGGKLPETFPVRAEDAPTAVSPDRYPGVNGQESYSEGIYVGYRWYDAQGIQPLFPFGHGLSYTQFEYSDLDVRRAEDGFDVSFVVRNVGLREGVEVPQLYLGPPRPAPAPMALRALVGFQRLVLDPGQSDRVSLHVAQRQLSYWSVSQHGWVVAAGLRPLYVGSSSRDTRLVTNLFVPGGEG
jgi:beta-glucosidase